ncbi:MAG: hypothetical protein V2J89_02395 [Halieaceae bacterium]|jgi:hypothetical protein|nr:hypothetical protein [Halieaceae bacterium]
MRAFSRSTALLFLAGFLACLAGCGELPKGDYPCLVATDSYETFNEAYVFAPGGDKQPVIDRAREAEQACLETEPAAN